MKPYQIRKLTDSPDVGEIRSEGRKSAVGKVAIINGKPTRYWKRNDGSEYNGYCKPHAKAVARRNIKRADKAKVMKQIKKDYD